MSSVWVRASSNVLGLTPGAVAEVENTDVVKAHVTAGYLVRLTKAEATAAAKADAEQALAAGAPLPPDPDEAGSQVPTS